MQDFPLKVGDLVPALKVQLLVGPAAQGVPVDLSTATAVKLTVAPANEGTLLPTLLDRAMVVVGAATNGTVEYVWVTGDTAVPGKYIAEVTVEWPGGPQTFPASGYFTVTLSPSLG